MTKVPESIDSNFRENDLSGALLPWAHGAPIYIQSSTPDRYYLPCFTDIDDLKLFLLGAGVFEYEVKRIGVGSEFLRSFEGSNITVVLNPSQSDGRSQVIEFQLPAIATWKLSQC